MIYHIFYLNHKLIIKMYSKQKNINDFLEDNREKEIIHINSVQNDN